MSAEAPAAKPGRRRGKWRHGKAGGSFAQASDSGVVYIQKTW